MSLTNICLLYRKKKRWRLWRRCWRNSPGRGISSE